ncbi:hypothetical protein Tco_1005197 [Tanacetum coccineum]|uniref:Reverse transcriptase n=1 Tax=Tanacetum coccineum TaxID=301880 RepID=A0ABQ5FES4_9ASTR
MDDPNITMEEYIRIEEEKARSREFPAIIFEKINGESFDVEQRMIMNEYNEGKEDYMTEFPTNVFNNTSDTTPPYEPTVSPPNESELDFRISCDESDVEDYTVIFDENSFSADSTDEFNFIDETSLSEYDEEIILLFNDLFNDIHSVDSKSEINHDDNNIGIIQSSEDMAPLLAADQRHPCLRYKVEGYTPRLTPKMRQDLAVRMRMVYHRKGQQVFMSKAWKRLFEIRAPLVREFMLEFLSTCRMSDTIMDLDTADTLCFQLGEARRRMTWR